MNGASSSWSRLPVGTKLLIAGAIVFIAAVSVVIVRTRSEPVRVALPIGSIEGEQRRRIVEALEAQGMNPSASRDEVLVPAERFAQSMAILRVKGWVGREAAGGWASLAAHKPAWYLSNEQNRQVYNLALQEELSRVVSAYPLVRKATVLVSHPTGLGFAATHRRPSASVSVEMASGTLDRRTVDAIAGLVSGAVAEMRPQDVAVIDATAGRQYKSREVESSGGGNAQNVQAAAEQAYRDRIVAALGYIDGLIVAVNVEVDLVERQTRSDVVDPLHTFELRTREKIENLGEEKGALTSDHSEREFEPAISRHQETATDPGGLPTRVRATVNVPRSYLVAAYRRQQGAGSSEPDDARLQSVMDEQIARIRRQVEPLIYGREPGQVVVDVYPDAVPPAVAPSTPAAIAPVVVTPPVVGAQLPPWSAPIAIGLLVVLLLGLRLGRARPATSRDTQHPEPGAAVIAAPDLSSLRDEHPQTIAMVLSKLPEEAAAHALIELPEEMQSQVLERMASLADPHPDILHEIDEYLACREQMAEPIASPDLLDRLNDATIRGVLDEVDDDSLRLAMRAAGEPFRRRVLRQLPEDQAARLRTELAAESPVRVSDVEAAQHRVLELAAQYQTVEGIAA